MTLEDKMKELYKDICKQFEEYQKTCDDLYSDYYNLQKRIDKAIKCLNYYTCNKEFLSVEEQELYEILKGEDK